MTLKIIRQLFVHCSYIVRTLFVHFLYVLDRKVLYELLYFNIVSIIIFYFIGVSRKLFTYDNHSLSDKETR